MLALLCFILSWSNNLIGKKKSSNLFFVQLLGVDGRGVCLQLQFNRQTQHLVWQSMMTAS